MQKRLICLAIMLVMMLFALPSLAEDNGAGALTWEELETWAASYKARALESQPLNDPTEEAAFSEDGYAFIYEFAMLYMDRPEMTEDAVIRSIVVTDPEEVAPRGTRVDYLASEVLNAYYNENPALDGDSSFAALYLADTMPDEALWGWVQRDGQRLMTIQYAVHEQLPSGGEGYADAGVIYTMAENRVSAVRVYGLDSRISLDTVNDVMYSVMLDALVKEYALVPFSYDGSELTVFGEKDTAFSGMDFLTMTAGDAAALLGEPVSDLWLENGEDGYIRVQTFPQAEFTWLYDQQKANGRIYMLCITADGLEGPRAVRCGDTFSSVYNRFRNGEGAYQEDGTEVLYGVEGEGSFGHASYGSDASATLRYGFTAKDGRKVVLHLNFSVMALTEIMLYAE